jgi:GNAT superfamily N-acetyltransferase
LETAAIKLRTAQPDDREFLFQLYSSTREFELRQTPWSDEQKVNFCRMQFEAQHVHYHKYYPSALFDIIEKDGFPVGRLYVDHWEHEIRIVDIALMPEHRGGGIGTGLLRQLQAEAQGAGKALSIHVEKFNPAMKLYERLGFLPLEDKGVYLLMKWTSINPS